MEGRGTRIVYLCREGSQAAPVAAGLHLGILPMDGSPRPRDLLATPYFGVLGVSDRGFLHFCGLDESGREIYVAGFGRAFSLVARAIEAAAGIIGLAPEGFRLVDCTSALGPLARLGGLLWRRLCAPGRGRLFLAWTVKGAYPRLAGLVARTRESASR